MLSSIPSNGVPRALAAVSEGQPRPNEALPKAEPAYQVEVFYDGDCPLCMREITLLKRKDRRHQILFTNIAASDFDANTVGVPWPELMQRIHGRLPDGTLIEGVEVFRRLYSAVGFGSLVRLTRMPGLSQVLDLSYELFAKNRLKLTGRCQDDACAVHPGTGSP